MGLESGVATRLLQGNPKNRILLGLALVFFGYFGRHLQFLLVIHKTNCQTVISSGTTQMEYKRLFPRWMGWMHSSDDLRCNRERASALWLISI